MHTPRKLYTPFLNFQKKSKVHTLAFFLNGIYFLYMQAIFFSHDNTVFLNTNLSEELFAKTKFSLLLQEEGFIVTPTEEKIDFKPFKFTGTKTENEVVYFTAPDFTGKNAEDLVFTQKDKKALLFSIIEIYLKAAKENIKLPANGLQGIIFDKVNNRFLFAPEKIFDRACGNLGKKNYSEIQDCWRDSLLSGKEALLYNAALLSYFALADKLPYPSDNEKQVNISQRNFLPVEYLINGIDKNLAEAINQNLLPNPKKEIPIESLKKELFDQESKKHKISDEEFSTILKNYEKKQLEKQKRKHFKNRYQAKAIALFLALIFALIAVTSILREHGRKPSVRGLTSIQVVEAFYAGLHHMDTDYMAACESDCPEAKRYIMQIPQIYVSTQMKSAYNFDSGISTPENWLFFEPDTKKSYSHFVFGISNFTVDNEASCLNIKLPLIKDRKAKLHKKSDGSKLYSGDESHHKVHYFLVHTVGEELVIDEYETEVILTFKNDSWKITKMNESMQSSSTGLLDFSLDYKASLYEEENNPLKATKNLKEKYRWLPYEKSMEEEKNRLDKIGY